MNIYLADEKATMSLGFAVARLSETFNIIYLKGDLGAGKTTFSRGFLNAFGHFGVVKSPTYTLMETYQFDARTIHHLDLYRLNDPEELEFIGLRDLIDSNAIFLVEWPGNGAGWLPEADLQISLVYDANARVATLESCEEKLLGNLDISAINSS